MTGWQQVKEELRQTWHSLAEGWRQLADRASGALTRFLPGSQQDEATDDQLVPWRGSGWGVMAADLYDDGKNLVVRLEAPGLEPQDFDLQVVYGRLLVSGEKHHQRHRVQGRYHVRECAYGRFERVVPLPAEVDVDRAKASYRHGVLRIELPKRVKSQPAGRRIPVN